MSVYSDKLRDLIDNSWPSIITNIDIAVTNLNVQKTELQAQIDAVEFAQGELETDSTSVLNGKGYYGMVIGSKFGTENLSYFAGYDEQDLTVSPATYNGSDSFTVTGDRTTLFTNGTIVKCDCGVDGIITRTVSSSAYVTVTTVTLVAGTNITSNLVSVDVVEGSIIDASRSSDDIFTVTDNLTSYFTPGTLVVCTDATDLLREVLSSSFGGGLTTVTLVEDLLAPLTGSLDGIIFPDYLYGGIGWDSDATLIANNAAFLDSYDHLYTPLGLTGTFGLVDRLDNIDTAITLQQLDKTYYQSFITLYEPYAT